MFNKKCRIIKIIKLMKIMIKMLENMLIALKMKVMGDLFKLAIIG